MFHHCQTEIYIYLAFHQLWHSTRVNIQPFLQHRFYYILHKPSQKIHSSFHIYFCTCEFVANLLIFCVSLFLFRYMHKQFVLSFPRIDCIKKRLSINKDHDNPIFTIITLKILVDSVTFLYQVFIYAF